MAWATEYLKSAGLIDTLRTGAGRLALAACPKGDALSGGPNCVAGAVKIRDALRARNLPADVMVAESAHGGPHFFVQSGDAKLDFGKRRGAAPTDRLQFRRIDRWNPEASVAITKESSWATEYLKLAAFSLDAPAGFSPRGLQHEYQLHMPADQGFTHLKIFQTHQLARQGNPAAIAAIQELQQKFPHLVQKLRPI